MPKAPEKPRKGVKGAPRRATVAKAKGGEKAAKKAPGKAKAKPAAGIKSERSGKATRTKTATPTKTATKAKTATPTKTATATRTATKTTTPSKVSPRARARAEQLGELPDRYEDDALVVLPVDPSTLFIWWDLAPRSVSQAAQGLSDPRARLAIVEGKNVVREVDLALESRSFYIHGLPAGYRYHAEILWLDARGQRRRIGHPSAPVGLPPRGPSRRVDDRFVMFRFDGKLGPGVDPARLPPGPGGELAEGAAGWGSSEDSDRAPPGGKPGSRSP